MMTIVLNTPQMLAPVATDGQQLLTRKEAAEIAGVCVATLDTKAKEGVLRKYRTGGVVRFKRQEVIDAFSQSALNTNLRTGRTRAKKA